MREFKLRTSQKPRPLPTGRWVMSQRWNDLLFAHWQVPASAIAPLLPEGLQPDTFQGSAWLGVVPLWMDRFSFRGLPPLPGTRNFPELHLRTYVQRPCTGTPGIFNSPVGYRKPAGDRRGAVYFSDAVQLGRDAAEPANGARVCVPQPEDAVEQPVIFNARYRGLGPTRRLAEIRSGSLEYFLHRALLPVLAKQRRRGGAGQYPHGGLAAGRCRGGDRAQRSSRSGRYHPADARAGAALFTASGCVCVAGCSHSSSQKAAAHPGRGHAPV